MVENMQQGSRATERNPKNTNAVLKGETAYPFNIRLETPAIKLADGNKSKI
jgi:hypothetical protein